MNKILFSLVLLSILFSCDPKREHREGLNSFSNKNGTKEEFYVYTNKLNGIYITYTDSLDPITIGTFQDGKRDGLWDTSVHNSSSPQIFFSEDTAVVRLKNKYFFKYTKYIHLDFTILNPVGWEVIDSMKTQSFLISRSSVYKGNNYIPQYFIQKVNVGTNDIGLIMDEFRAGYSNDSSMINFTKTSICTYSVSKVTEGDTVVYNSKIINTKTGVYSITVKCSQREYHIYYYYVFKTLLNSFNPISGTGQ